MCMCVCEREREGGEREREREREYVFHIDDSLVLKVRYSEHRVVKDEILLTSQIAH